MAYYKDPIHGRLKLIVRNAGGYDINFHIDKVSKEENIDREVVKEIFSLVFNNKTRYKYIKAYKNGFPLESIKKIEKVKEDRAMEYFALLSGLASEFCPNIVEYCFGKKKRF